ncbi:hypothetical protein M8J76_002487 [Diaphorina citri]|nr:hypothetical protein M8J76_002487 [Diaphorina citri]
MIFISESKQHFSKKLIDSYSSGVSREPGLPRAPVHQINHDGFSHDELNSPPEPQPQQIIYRVVGSRSHVKKSDSSQQTDSSLRNSQWKKYINSPERTTKLLSDESPSSSRSREKRPGQISRKNGRKKIGVPGEEQSLEDFNKMGERSRSRESSRENKTKVWGVPQSFRYVNKRPVSGSSKRETQTAQVSAVPRTKVKISGGTQTDMKSYFISSANSSPRRSSSNIRERVILASQSLPKGSTRLESGSLSDSNFTESAMHGRSNGDHHSSPLRHSSTYTAPLPMKAAGMSEAESIESLPAQLHQRTSLTHSRLISCGSPGPRLSRSNSIRSTKSEKLYPSMLQRSEEVESNYYTLNNHCSQPTSPTPVYHHMSGSSNRMKSQSVMHSPRNSPFLSKVNSKDEDVHGSAMSLASVSSSIYSTPEERQSYELRKLRRELVDAQEKVQTLSSQLNTNSHVVSAFEQSLSNMTQRLQQLTVSAEEKDSELMELRQTIEFLRKQSVETGLSSSHSNNTHSLPNSISRRHTINAASENNVSHPSNGSMYRQLSTDSVSSLNSLSSICSFGSSLQHYEDKKKKRGWLRSSFSKAFSRKKNRNETGDVNTYMSAPSSPLLNSSRILSGSDAGFNSSHNSSGHSSNRTEESNCSSQTELIEELRRQLREKDLVLTDIRLEALSSAHQLESLKDTVIKMRNEMSSLKQDNERLQRLVAASAKTPNQANSQFYFNANEENGLDHFNQSDVLSPDELLDGKKVVVSVYLGSHGSYHRYLEDNIESEIGTINIQPSYTWEQIDLIIYKLFKEYLEQIDPMSNLGLGVESVWSYHIGNISRYKDQPADSELESPYSYLGSETHYGNISICLKGALQNSSHDALAFDTLISKSIVHRYTSLLLEHKRIIFCGPSGTGKSYLAGKLAEFLVFREGKINSTAEGVATFNVDNKNSKELRQYLANIADQCENNANDVPLVLILDNLHHATSLGEVFNGFLNAKFSKCPYIIGTMNQATCSTTNLKLHHNFRWILCANHMEPVKGFLGRYLRRKLIENKCQTNRKNQDMCKVVEWLPRVWHYLNQFLETHSSCDVTIGPRLFLSCPSDVAGSQVWFTDLWNYSIVPYLMEAVREGIQLYGRRAPFTDPAYFITETYPWPSECLAQGVPAGPNALIRLRPEDVGYDVEHGDLSSRINPSMIASFSPSYSSQPDLNDSESTDPLMNMLLRLQEAANSSSKLTAPKPSESTGDANGKVPTSQQS